MGRKQLKKYDLVVVGGGFAGVAAAVSAERQGIRVLILEKMNCFGGKPGQKFCFVHGSSLYGNFTGPAGTAPPV